MVFIKKETLSIQDALLLPFEQENNWDDLLSATNIFDKKNQVLYFPHFIIDTNKMRENISKLRCVNRLLVFVIRRNLNLYLLPRHICKSIGTTNAMSVNLSQKN
jgi:hypothetical protein